MILGLGELSVRFRPPINISKSEIDMGMDILDKVISSI